jgi:hypothetical protein
MKIWNKLKVRWGVKSNFQVLIILLIFSLTGFTTLYLHKSINSLLGINAETSLWIKSIIFVFIVLPIFSLLLLIWGTILGQKEFVTEFLKYKIRLIFRKK